MKKRNEKWAKENQFRRLKEDLRKNWKAQKDLGWVELEVPIFKGWTAKIEPREDIQNRDDAWVFWWICKNLSSETFCRKMEDFPWISKKKRVFDWIIEPHVNYINEDTYNNLDPQIKKYFSPDILGTLSKEYKYRFGTWYICNIPDFYWKIVYIKTYTTKAKIIDEILLQEESEIEYFIHKEFYDSYYRFGGVPRHFRNMLNRKQRRKAKEDIKREINGLDPLNSVNYKDAKWLWW